MILVVSTGRSLGIPEEILEVSLSPGVKSYLECSTTFRCIMTFTLIVPFLFLLPGLNMPL